MDTHLQRPTDTLHFSTTRQQIQSLFTASILINKGQFAQAIKHYEDILIQLPNKLYSAYQLEIQYNKILAQLYLSTQFSVNVQSMIQKCTKDIIILLKKLTDMEQNYLIQEEEDQWLEGEDLRIRIYTTMLQLSVKYSNIKLQQWLTGLLKKLKIYPKYLPQVLGKLCGCKYLKQFCQNFNSDQIINEQNKTTIQKAQLIDMASNWLIVGGKLQKGLKCKQQAVNLWKTSNSLKQYKKCESQLKQLKQNENTDYCIKLKKVARIITKLLKQFQNQNQQQNQHQNEQKRYSQNVAMIVKKSMNKNLQQIQKWNEQLQKIDQQLNKQKKSFWSSFKKSSNSTMKKSILKQETKLSQWYQKSYQFYKQIYSKQNNQQITSLMIGRSKYILEQKKLFSKLLIPLIQQYTIRQRYAFLKIKTDYIIKKGLVNPQFSIGNSSNKKGLNDQANANNKNNQLTKQSKSIVKDLSSSPPDKNTKKIQIMSKDQGIQKNNQEKNQLPSNNKQISKTSNKPNKTPQKSTTLNKKASTQMKKQESDSEDSEQKKLQNLLAKFQKKKKKKL